MSNENISYITLAGVHESTNEEIPGAGTGAEFVAEAEAAAEAAAVSATEAAAAATLAAQAAATVDSEGILLARDQAVAAQTGAEAARNQAIAAATAAEATAANVDQALEGVSDDVVAANEAAVRAETEADRARSYVSALPGEEVEPGIYGARHYVEEQRALLARAPSLQGRAITGGAVGVNNHPTLFTDFFTSIMVSRAAGVNTLVQPQAGQWTAPADPPHSHSWAWQEWINAGDGYVEFEPPGGGSTVFQPSPIVTPQFRQLRQTGTAPPAGTVSFAIEVPAGVDRVVIMRTASTYQGPGPNLVTHAIAGTTGFTTHKTVGDGLHGGISPIVATLHSAEIAGTGVATITPNVGFPVGVQLGEVLVEVYQDCDAVELADILLRAGTGTSETFSVTPTVPQSAVSVMAVHHGGDKAPVGLTNVTSLTQNSTGSRTDKDFSNAWGQDYDVAASIQTYTGSSAVGGPAAISGIVLKPVSRTTGGAGTFIVDSDWVAPYRLNKGDKAELRALNDGLIWGLFRQ